MTLRLSLLATALLLGAAPAFATGSAVQGSTPHGAQHAQAATPATPAVRPATPAPAVTTSSTPAVRPATPAVPGPAAAGAVVQRPAVTPAPASTGTGISSGTLAPAMPRAN